MIGIETFGQQVHRRRLALRMSVGELAELAGISRHTIYEAEAEARSNQTRIVTQVLAALDEAEREMVATLLGPVGDRLDALAEEHADKPDAHHAYMAAARIVRGAL